MHGIKNITKNEMLFFQNDMLTDLKKLELQIESKITNMSQTLLSKTNEYDLKITKISDNIKQLISQIAARKFDNERIEELLSLKNKFSEQIMENQNRIIIIDKTLDNSIYKYDKLIIDNLQVPGLIGTGCIFKNCRLFFENIYNELKVNLKNKEQDQTLIKNFQEKIESRVYKIENELNKILQNVNHICQSKFEKFFETFEERLKITENMVNISRIENSRYSDNLIKTSNSLQIQWEKLENIKTEIYEKFNEERDIFKKIVDSTNRNYYNQDKEFKIFKQRFTQLAEYLKEFKNQKYKEYRELKKNIDFTKKQKLTNNFDLESYNRIGNDVKKYIKSPSPKRNRRKFDLNESDKSNKEIYSSLDSGKKRENNINIISRPKRNSMFNHENNIKIDLKMSNNNLPLNNKIKENNNVNVKTVTNLKINKRKLNEIGLKTIHKNVNKKQFLKIIKKQKTIVTNNNINLNFESKNKMNKIEEKNILKEESDDGEDNLLSDDSRSSNISLSSMIASLHNMSQSEEKNNKKKDNTNKEKEINKIIDINKANDKEKQQKEKNIDKKENFNKVNNNEIINNKEKLKSINNNEKTISIEKTNNKENSNSIEKKGKNKNKNTENEVNKILNLKENLNDKFYKTVNNFPKNNYKPNITSNNNNSLDLENKSNSTLNYNQSDDSLQKSSLSENKEGKSKNSSFFNDDIQKDNEKQTIKKILDKKKKLQLTEYNNHNKNNLKINNRLSNEKPFPQIKTISTESNIKNKMTNNAFMTTESNTSRIFQKTKINFNNILLRKSNSKEENQKDKKLSLNIINYLNEDKDKEILNTNAIDKEINKKNSNNSDNINNNAFLTSLNNINNNYNYYYNNNNLNDNKNIINILNNKNQLSDEKMDKFNIKIDLINGNIKSINSRIIILEERYQVILNQLKNILKIVSSHYYYKKRKSIVNKGKATHKKEELIDNKTIMTKIKDIYNDNDFCLKIPNNEFSKAIKKIEPFLIKKFKKNQ